MDLAFELHDLVRTLDRDADRLLRPSGLGYSRYVALVVLDEHPGLSGRALAGALGTSEAAASKLLRRLLDDGLVTDASPHGSGHVRHLQLTDTGRAALAQAGDLLGDALDHQARAIGLDPHELARTIRALHDQLRRPAESHEQETP